MLLKKNKIKKTNHAHTLTYVWMVNSNQAVTQIDQNMYTLFQTNNIIIIIIIITFKGAIRDFLQSPHSAANCLQHVRSSGQGAIVCNYVQHIKRLACASVMLRATWYKGTAQLLSLTELKSYLFGLYFIG